MSCIKPGPQNDSSKTLESTGDLKDVHTKNKALISSANKIFGKTWSHSVTNTTIDFIDTNMGKYYVGCQATVKVQLSNGIFHEDIGYCNVEAPLKGFAIEKARLSAVTNALQNVLSCFVEMNEEMRQITSEKSMKISNISVIQKTKFPVKRPITPPPPPAQSTPKMSRNLATMQKIQGKVVKNLTNLANAELKVSEPSNKMETDIKTDDVFDILDDFPGSPTSFVPTTTSTSSAPMTEDEIRLERKRRQREKQEEFQRIQKEKEEREMKNRQEVQKPNPKY